MTPSFSRNVTSRKCYWNIGVAVEQEERSCDEVETVGEFTYLSNWTSAGG